MTIQNNLQRFLRNFQNHLGKVGKTRNDISLLFATKYLTADQFISFIDITKHFDIDNLTIGENRVQDWEKKLASVKEKRPDLLDSFKPVMIGTLQKNKIHKALEIFEEIHSVDSIELAQAIDQRAGKGRRIPIYIEVNVSREKSKHGFRPEDLEKAIIEIKKLRNEEIKGLMTMAPGGARSCSVRPQLDSQSEIRYVFRTLRKLADQYSLKTSMGISYDWEIAVEEGTDMVRIGSAVFR